MIRISNLRMSLDFDLEELKSAAAKKLKIGKGQISDIRLTKKSVDARDKQNVFFVCSIELETQGEKQLLKKLRDRNISLAADDSYMLPEVKPSDDRPVVVGFGPAGMFAALLLAQAGQQPIVIERGQAVEERKQAVSAFWNRRELDENSNIQFGEGGAGTFSDGKLNTGTRDIRIKKMLEEFVAAGAPGEILYEAKPHIGTDLLSVVVKNIRLRIIELGGDVLFNCKMTGISHRNGQINSISYREKGCISDTNLPCRRLILATGHSARDIFEMLNSINLPMEAKAFSVGARIEHKARLIDKAQYGNFAGHKALGAAEYKLSAHLEGGRGVYSFCMCPGGVVTAAASEAGAVVTNGMSNHARSAENSNSAILVGVTPQDYGTAILDGVKFQRHIEQQAFILAGSSYAVPGQRLGDFFEGRASSCFGSIKPSCMPETLPMDISGCLPEFVVSAMRQGIHSFGRRLEGFAMEDAVLTAPETRSSSPVRILRDKSRQSPMLKGLYPCGEGAGYAGGITSAAVDGIKTAEAVMGISL